jgi:hypothetical protein
VSALSKNQPQSFTNPSDKENTIIREVAIPAIPATNSCNSGNSDELGSRIYDAELGFWNV